MNYITEYYEKICSGEITTSKRIKQIYKKAVEELNTPKPPFVFSEEKANRPIEFIERFCKNSKGKWMGKPITLELWQKALIQVVYGFINKHTGLRRVREVFVVCARKSGKSVMVSGIGLYEMMSEKGSQVVCVATKRDQAKIVFDEAFNMVKQSPDLLKHIRKRKTDLYFEKTFSTFTPLCSQSNSLDGLNAQLGIIDECHAIRDRNLYDVVRQSQSSREQPLMLTISTSGFVRESLYDNLYQYACNVLDGIIDDPAFVPFVYELDSEEEWTDPDCWIKANPSLGTIKSIEELTANVEKAKIDETFKPTVLTKDLNIVSTISGSWLDFSTINNNLTFDINDFKGSYSIGGVDLSESGDLTCATIICMKKNDLVKYVLQHYWIPADIAKKKEVEDKIPYTAFIKQGILSLSGSMRINYSDVTAWFDYVKDELKIIPYWIYYDEWNAAFWVDEMKSKRYQLCVARQGYKSISPVMKEMTLDFKQNLINYNQNNLLKWCLSNTMIISDPAGNIKFDKSKNKKLRIDGTASLYCAFKGLLDNYKYFQNLIK